MDSADRVVAIKEEMESITGRIIREVQEEYDISFERAGNIFNYQLIRMSDEIVENCKPEEVQIEDQGIKDENLDVPF